MNYSILQIREFFHLAFLHALVRKIPVGSFVVKGGCNIRFFFGSDRYSEDLDLDLVDVPVYALKDRVMSILQSSGLVDTLQAFGVERITPPDLAKAKQTETVQRFKVHLHTTAGEDLPTKVEFSRRGLDTNHRSESVISRLVNFYHMPPLILPHYTAESAIRQKIGALVGRALPQARDVFDLFILNSRINESESISMQGLEQVSLKEAVARVDAIDYARYRDTVLDFLASADQPQYTGSAIWDEIRLVAISLLEKILDRES